MSKPLIEVTGFKELQDKIKLIADDKTKRAEVLKILRVVARPTVQAAKAFAPKSKKPHTISGSRTKQVIAPGNLSKSIGNITGKSENPTILVGPRVKGKNLGFYGAWVETGVNIYKKGFKRKRSKSASASNNAGAKKRTTGAFFMKKSFELTKGQVTNDAEKKIAAYIQKTIDKLSK
jgi:hypothetical protein